MCSDDYVDYDLDDNLRTPSTSLFKKQTHFKGDIEIRNIIKLAFKNKS